MNATTKTPKLTAANEEILDLIGTSGRVTTHEPAAGTIRTRSIAFLKTRQHGTFQVSFQAAKDRAESGALTLTTKRAGKTSYRLTSQN